MWDGLKSDDLCYRQNCYYALFPGQAQRLRDSTMDYFCGPQGSAPFPVVTQIFKRLIEQNSINPNLLTEEDKKQIFDQYTRERVADFSHSKEYVTIFNSIFEQDKAKESKRVELEIATKNYVQFEANRYTGLANFYLEEAIREINKETSKRETSLIADIKRSTQKSKVSSSKIDAQNSKKSPITSLGNLLARLVR